MMLRRIKYLPLIAVAGVLSAAAAQAPPPSADAQLATMKQYCTGCHNDKLKIGGASFDGVTAASVAKNPELFEKAVRKLRGRVMPPPGAKQPDGKTVDSLVAFLEDSLDKLPEPAHITDKEVLHRLNRKEYENAIHDLLLVDVNASELLPPDDSAQATTTSPPPSRFRLPSSSSMCSPRTASRKRR